MPMFQYTVRDQTGAVRTGTSEAPDSELLRYRLQEQGFDVQDLTPVNEKVGQRQQSKVRVPRAEVLAFWIQFSIMTDGKVSRLYALDVCAQRASSLRFASIIQNLHIQVASGTPLHQALANYPQVFDAHTIGIVHAGEVANAMSDAIHRLIALLQSSPRRSD